MSSAAGAQRLRDRADRDRGARAEFSNEAWADWFLPAAPPPVETRTVVRTIVSRAISTIISLPISVVRSAIPIICGGVAAIVGGRIATVAIAGSVIPISRAVSVCVRRGSDDNGPGNQPAR